MTARRLARLGLATAVGVAGLAVFAPGAPPVHAATWSVTDLDGGATAMGLAQELAGQGVQVTGATFTGNNRQAGLFSGPGVADAIGISDGVVLSSGAANEVAGPNQSGSWGTSFGGLGDAYLDSIVTPYQTHDAAVLDVTFIPSAVDLEINYVFASEEYPEWVDSSFNDVFAFTINGENCATVATESGTPTPVTINTINDHLNSQIYVANEQSPETGASAFDTQFDGFTQVLTCIGTVVPGEENTLHIAIADTSDGIYDSAVFLESSGITSTPKTKYQPLNQSRIFDSRQTAKLPAGGEVTIPVKGLYGIPDDAVSVALNVTAADPEAQGFLTVYPSGQGLPTASNVNYGVGGASPNLVVVKIGDDGAIKVYSSSASHVIVDLFGYYSVNASYGFLPVAPARAVDTRAGAKPVKGSIVTFPVAGLYGVPADAVAVALNLTIAEPSESAWAVAYPAGDPLPNTSNVNFEAGETRPNVVFAKVGAGGQVSVYIDSDAHVIADVFGYYSAASDTELYKPVKPKRLIDTRLPAPGTPIPAGGTIEVKVTDIGGVPSTASAVILNITVSDPQGQGYLTVYPADIEQPNSSNLNYVAGEAIPNVVVSGVSPDGRVKIYSYAQTNVIVDVAGWFG